MNEDDHAENLGHVVRLITNFLFPFRAMLFRLFSKSTRVCILVESNCVFRSFSAMEVKCKRSYEEAVYALNGLQSNSAYIQKARLGRGVHPDKNLSDTIQHLGLLGVKLEDLNSLNVIHVSGTKGKGSTCAFTESILRQHGFKTGFYSSPHLISVSERIRINGKPIEKDMFASYFWHVFDVLRTNLKTDDKMPTYFLFLTVMAYYVFLKEKVDVAVMEVGIGGLYDCTNVIQKPIVVGITTLGLDHISILGDTIVKIAEQKAGIFKPGVPAFTVPQVESAMAVLKRQSEIKKCPLHIAPSLDAYDQRSHHFNLGVPGVVQKLNASLALQLCKVWLDSRKANNGNVEVDVNPDDCSSTSLPLANVFPLSLSFFNGLQSCIWPGRFQIAKKEKFTFYLDGAHTIQSMRYCTRWFQEYSKKEEDTLGEPVCRILLFNCTGERKAESLLDPLSELHFDMVLFSPNRLSVMKDSSSDQSNFNVDPAEEMSQCTTNREIWCHLMRSYHENAISVSSRPTSFPSLSSIHRSKYCNPENTLMFTCLKSVINWLNGKITKDTLLNCISRKDDLLRLHSIVSGAKHVQVLVTGSLHLVGNVLGVIDPNLDIAPASFQ